jgi:hypothetical protein
MSLPPPPPAPPPPPGFDYGDGAPAVTASKATGALVCGIIGLLLCGIVLGPVAIYLGTQAKKEIRSSNGRLKGDGMATAGIVMGIIAVIGFVISIGYLFAR